MTKQEAADFLGISVRALERHTADSRVAASYEKGKTRPVLNYEKNELERFKAELSAPRHRPALERGGSDPNSATSLATFGDIPPEAALRGLIQLLQMATRNAPVLEGEGTGGSSSTSSRFEKVPTADKTLLSLDEAGAITGLSRAFLKDAITSDHLEARKIGRAWRIKRRDLDRFVDDL